MDKYLYYRCVLEQSKHICLLSTIVLLLFAKAWLHFLSDKPRYLTGGKLVNKTWVWLNKERPTVIGFTYWNSSVDEERFSKHKKKLAGSPNKSAKYFDPPNFINSDFHVTEKDDISSLGTDSTTKVAPMCIFLVHNGYEYTWDSGDCDSLSGFQFICEKSYDVFQEET